MNYNSSYQNIISGRSALPKDLKKNKINAPSKFDFTPPPSHKNGPLSKNHKSESYLKQKKIYNHNYANQF